MTDPNPPHDLDDPATLDPPGKIAVVGAGPLGIEAALYGRFLGYDVTLIESETVGHSLTPQRDQPLPMLPNRCVSSLAISALQAQSPDAPPITLPTTVAQWIDELLVPLTTIDLLAGRLRCPFRVTHIEFIPVELDAEDLEENKETIEYSGDIPPDFRLTLAGVDGRRDELDVEAVILAIGTAGDVPCEFARPCDYFFRVGESSCARAEADFLAGLKQIVQIYASLAGRESLDLYRPDRL